MDLKERLEILIKEWHEAGRAGFEKRYNSLNYDEDQKKTIKEKNKYFYLDCGSSGAYIVEKATGGIYGAKAYGVIHRGHYYGNIKDINGSILRRCY